MKVLNPTVTVMLASHMKALWLPSSLDSVLAQTRRDMQVIVCDSGAWIEREPSGAVGDMGPVYGHYSRHPLIEWVTLDQTWPTPLPWRACPYTYVWNRVIEAGLVRGRYLAVFTDDDLYHPEFAERMAGYLDDNATAGAVYCSQRREHPDGHPAPMAPGGMADRPRGPGEFQDQVDMTQVMFRTSLFDSSMLPLFNEAPADQVCRRADGEFLEELARIVGVVPNIPEVLVTHRYTPESTYN